MSLTANDNRPEGSTLLERGWAYLHERLGLEVAEALAAKKRVPIHRSTLFYFLGGMAIFLFGLQIVTGILLSLYYKPSPDQAFESVRAIMTEVEYGWLMRSIHSWSANLLVAVLFLHLMTTYMMRGYRRPREFTWVTGCTLLGLFMAFGFSGYLLPWNELAFFATKVGTGITGVVPVVGDHLLMVARSGENVTGDTLARFYSLHVVILPLAVFGLMGIHLFLVQQHGMSVPDREAAAHGGKEKIPSMPFVPHFLLRDMVGWYLALGLLAAFAALFPWELGEKCNPFGSAPEGIKPEWYFLFMFQALKKLPPHLIGGQDAAEPFDVEGEVVGVLFFGFCGLMVLVVPFLDRGSLTRGLLNVATAVSAAFVIVMTAWGWFPDNLRWATLLGATLFTLVLSMALPFVDRGGVARRGLYALIGLCVLVLISVTVWDLLV